MADPFLDTRWAQFEKRDRVEDRRNDPAINDAWPRPEGWDYQGLGPNVFEGGTMVALNPATDFIPQPRTPSKMSIELGVKDIKLVPVDHQPDFGERWAGVPVDHDPFADDAQGMANQGQYALMASRLREMAADHRQAPADQAAMMPETYANPLADTLIQGAMAIPKRAFEASETYRQGGDYNPGPILEAAMLPMGTGAIAGVPVRAGEAVLGAGPIRAYHGSPHDFDRFSLDKIGTGEGAQAYGHGLYFAENPKVAEAYKNDPAMMSFVKGKDWTPEQEEAFTWLHENGYDQAKASQAVADRIGKARMYGDTLDSTSSLFHVKNLIDSGWQPPRGKMYEVNINADPEHFLDWDKPLTQQSPQVQEALKKSMGKNWDEFKHADAGTAVKNGFIAPSPEGTAGKLSGIPGIKYLDQGSRGAGEGSRNYVVFDHDLVNIVRKYAIAGIALPPAIAAQYRQMLAGQSQ